MKKITLLATALIALNLVGCSTVQNKNKENINKENTEISEKTDKFYKDGEFYKFEGKVYDIYENKPLTGIVQSFDDYGYDDDNDSYKLETYKDGEQVGYKIVEDSSLVLQTNIKNGLGDGKLFYENGVTKVEINFEDGMAQGLYVKKYLKDETYTKYNLVNGLFHGKAEIKDYKGERIVYYNGGEVVKDQNQVKKLEKLNTKDAIEFDELQNKDSKYYTEDEKLFSGIAKQNLTSDYTGKLKGKTYHYITDGILIKSLSLKLTHDDPAPDVYFISEIKEYKGDTIIDTYYNMWYKTKEVTISKKTNKVLKTVLFSSKGERE